MVACRNSLDLPIIVGRSYSLPVTGTDFSTGGRFDRSLIPIERQMILGVLACLYLGPEDAVQGAVDSQFELFSAVYADRDDFDVHYSVIGARCSPGSTADLLEPVSPA